MSHDRLGKSDTFKILLATDCHLGYEAKTKRSQDMDSFVTFEEILKTAHEKSVDFILLGGDLFHDCKPSQRIVQECVDLLKKYCLGTRPITIQFLSNPEEVFVHSADKTVNYENENLNISMPIFSIHGNHDNPSFESTGTLDILMSTGLINYFGKWSNLQEITVTPMIFRKGDSHVAIYGLGHVGEQRLSRLFKEGKVTFLQPQNIPALFNILVIHQNRARHSENSFIAEDQLPGWFDLIFWGHEHECRISPEEVTPKGGGTYYICQPGSSVATSLCIGEAVEKHIGLLSVRAGEFKMKKIKLQTVRPFVFHEIDISEKIKSEVCEASAEGVFEYIDDYIENTCIPEGKKKLTGHDKQPEQPLIRLKIHYTEEFQVFDTMKLCNKYCDLVANAKDMIIFRRMRSGSNGRMRKANDHTDDLAEELAECFRHNAENAHEWSTTVQSGIEKYFAKKDYKLKVLSLAGMNEALNRCIVAGDDSGFEEIFDYQIKKSAEYLKNREMSLTADDVIEELRKYRREKLGQSGEEKEIEEMQKILNEPGQRVRATTVSDVDIGDTGDETDAAPAGRGGRGRGRGRGARGATTRGGSTRARGRGKMALDVSASPPPAKKVATTSRVDTSMFNRYANVSSQNHDTSLTQSTRSQKPAVNYISSSDSD